MNGADQKERDRQIAQNEEKRRVAGAIRVSGWAIAFAVVVCAVIAWLWYWR